jgi:hypothetical protein
MKKKKWFYLIGIIVIVIPVLFLYVTFNATFLSKWKAKQVALDYLDTMYEDGQYSYESTKYSFKDKSYYVRYYGEGPVTRYSATVEVGTGLWPTKVLYTHMNDNSPDENLDIQINDAAADELKNLLNAYPIASIHYTTASPSTFGYTVDTFSIYEKKPFKPTILIYLEKADRTEAEALEIVKGIQSTMNEANVHYLSFQIQQDRAYSNVFFDVTKTEIETYR